MTHQLHVSDELAAAIGPEAVESYRTNLGLTTGACVVCHQPTSLKSAPLTLIAFRSGKRGQVSPAHLICSPPTVHTVSEQEMDLLSSDELDDVSGVVTIYGTRPVLLVSHSTEVHTAWREGQELRDELTSHYLRQGWQPTSAIATNDAIAPTAPDADYFIGWRPFDPHHALVGPATVALLETLPTGDLMAATELNIDCPAPWVVEMIERRAVDVYIGPFAIHAWEIPFDDAAIDKALATGRTVAACLPLNVHSDVRAIFPDR